MKHVRYGYDGRTKINDQYQTSGYTRRSNTTSSGIGRTIFWNWTKLIVGVLTGTALLAWGISEWLMSPSIGYM